MKILYISNSRIPTEKAYGIQIMKMCEAFSVQNNDVELILPTRKSKIFKNIDAFEFYSVKQNFKIIKLKCFDPNFLITSIQGIYIKFQILFFIYNLKKYLKKNKNKNLILYTRDEYILPILQKFSKKVVWEAHTLPKNKRHYLKYWGKCFRIITISQGLKNELVKLGLNENKILVASDGVDLEKFKNINHPQPFLEKEGRQRLNLPADKKIILYAGHLYNWKGVQILADASKFLDKNILIVFVGGTDFDIKNFKNKNQDLIKENKILILGYKKPESIPKYLKSADILVLPNSAKNIKSSWTSPLKLFEYMASNVPIIASDLVSIKEVLNKNNAIFFKPDDSKDLAEKIKNLLQNQDLSVKISTQALKDVQNYTWQKRVKKIINFVK